MSKNIDFNNEAREKLKAGLSKVARSVKITLGPMGRNVVIQQPWGDPHVTKDGVTVARDIVLPDPVENMGAQMLKQAALKTSDTAGDGTTTATVIAEEIVNMGLQFIDEGSNPIDIKKGIDIAVTQAIDYLRKLTIPVKTDSIRIKQIGTISANNDSSVGELIADAIKQVGADGIITAEEGNGMETSIDVVTGMQIDRGYMSPYFVTDPNKMICEYNNPLIVISDKSINGPVEIIPILEAAHEAKRPLLLIAETIDNQTMNMLAMNRVKNSLPVVAIKCPGYGDKKQEIMEDLISVCGGYFMSDKKGDDFQKFNDSCFGTCDKIIIDKEKTVIVGGPRTDVDKKIESIREQINRAKGEFEKDMLKKRLARLSGGVAVIAGGAPTEIEMKEKKDRIDDAIHATRAALEAGIVPGGGIAYFNAAKEIQLDETVEDVSKGMQCVVSALKKPIITIIKNAGREPNLILQAIVEKNAEWYGYDARNGVFDDLLSIGIIDPNKVCESAIKNAASVAGMVLLTECAITDINKPGSEPTN